MIDGRRPFPRIAPPFRHGVDELGDGDELGGRDRRWPAPGQRASPPTLVNNVETLANVPGILAHGADWFRAVGTPESPGTVVCTVTGDTRRARRRRGRRWARRCARSSTRSAAAPATGAGSSPSMSGVANPLLPAAALDTPLSLRGDGGRSAAGSARPGSSCSTTPPTSSPSPTACRRFLAVESCGQCTPCKQDGLAHRRRCSTGSAASDADRRRPRRS